VTIVVVEASDLLAADLGDRPVTEEGEDELLEASPIFLPHRGLEMHRNVLGIEVGGDILHRHRVAAAVALGQWIDTLAQGGQVLNGDPTRLLGGYHVNVAQHHPSRPAHECSRVGAVPGGHVAILTSPYSERSPVIGRFKGEDGRI
jgi:hypothetical protein